jgi:hypothetical protein
MYRKEIMFSTPALPAPTTLDSQLRQHTLVASIALHLVPGALGTLFYVLTAPMAMRLGFPPLLAIYTAIVVIITFELGYVLAQGKQHTGRLSLRAIVLYIGSTGAGVGDPCLWLACSDRHVRSTYALRLAPRLVFIHGCASLRSVLLSFRADHYLGRRVSVERDRRTARRRALFPWLSVAPTRSLWSLGASHKRGLILAVSLLEPVAIRLPRLGRVAVGVYRLVEA